MSGSGSGRVWEGLGVPAAWLRRGWARVGKGYRGTGGLAEASHMVIWHLPRAS